MSKRSEALRRRLYGMSEAEKHEAIKRGIEKAQASFKSSTVLPAPTPGPDLPHVEPCTYDYEAGTGNLRNQFIDEMRRRAPAPDFPYTPTIDTEGVERWAREFMQLNRRSERPATNTVTGRMSHRHPTSFDVSFAHLELPRPRFGPRNGAYTVSLRNNPGQNVTVPEPANRIQPDFSNSGGGRRLNPIPDNPEPPEDAQQGSTRFLRLLASSGFTVQRPEALLATTRQAVGRATRDSPPVIVIDSIPDNWHEIQTRTERLPTTITHLEDAGYSHSIAETSDMIVGVDFARSADFSVVEERVLAHIEAGDLDEYMQTPPAPGYNRLQVRDYAEHRQRFLDNSARVQAWHDDVRGRLRRQQEAEERTLSSHMSRLTDSIGAFARSIGSAIRPVTDSIRQMQEHTARFERAMEINVHTLRRDGGVLTADELSSILENSVSASSTPEDETPSVPLEDMDQWWDYSEPEPTQEDLQHMAIQTYMGEMDASEVNALMHTFLLYAMETNMGSFRPRGEVNVDIDGRSYQMAMKFNIGYDDMENMFRQYGLEMSSQGGALRQVVAERTIAERNDLALLDRVMTTINNDDQLRQRFEELKPELRKTANVRLADKLAPPLPKTKSKVQQELADRPKTKQSSRRKLTVRKSDKSEKSDT